MALSLNSGLLQINGLVAAVLVELCAPYLVQALMLGWTEADGRSQPLRVAVDRWHLCVPKTSDGGGMVKK